MRAGEEDIDSCDAQTTERARSRAAFPRIFREERVDLREAFPPIDGAPCPIALRATPRAAYLDGLIITFDPNLAGAQNVHAGSRPWMLSEMLSETNADTTKDGPTADAAARGFDGPLFRDLARAADA